MVQRKRKKNVRYQGSKTHGGGSMKKRRGAGSRGGRGNAGSGKRGDVKKPTYIKQKRRFGKAGFKPQNKIPVKSVTTEYLQVKTAMFLEKGLAEQKDGMITVNLSKLGFDKLVCKGNLTGKYNITCFQASKGAVEKVKAAGGSITVLSQPQAQEQQPAEE